jgi:hypothetical protein
MDFAMDVVSLAEHFVPVHEWEICCYCSGFCYHLAQAALVKVDAHQTKFLDPLLHCFGHPNGRAFGPSWKIRCPCWISWVFEKEGWDLALGLEDQAADIQLSEKEDAVSFNHYLFFLC